MRILLLQDQREVAEKIVFFLESTYGGRVEEVTNLKRATELVQDKENPVNLILFDFRIGNIMELKAFWEASAQIPVILCVQGGEKGPVSKNHTSGNVVGTIDRSQFVENLVGTVDMLIDAGAVQAVKPEAGQVRIKTKLLLSVCPLEGDIFIKLNNTKFVKLFRKGDVFDLQDLEKYTIKKGVEYLYIREEQCTEFVQKYKTQLEELLKKEISITDIAKVSESIHETVQELSSRIGFTKEVQELAKMQVKMTMKAIGKSKGLADLIDQLKKTEGQYLAAHSVLTSYLACAIAAQVEWGSEPTFQKLGLAAFLHDITLSDNTLAACNTIDEAKNHPRTKFSDELIKQYEQHPTRAAEIARKFHEVPPDVDTIIVQHHERTDGSGFPRKLNHSRLAPLTCVFIVAHDLAQVLIRDGVGFDATKFIADCTERYNTNQFRKIISILTNLHNIKGLAAAVHKPSAG